MMVTIDHPSDVPPTYHLPFPLRSQEKRLIGKYFDEISQDTGKYVFGVDDTLKALEMGAVETLIVWENLDVNRYTLKVRGGGGERKGGRG